MFVNAHHRACSQEETNDFTPHTVTDQPQPRKTFLYAKRSITHEIQRLLGEILLKGRICLESSFDQRSNACLHNRLAEDVLERRETLLPFSHCGEARALVDDLFSCSESFMVPACNAAGKAVDEVFEFSVWDGAIDPFRF